jgi:phosphoesterase RecJ-like protein
VNGPVAGGAVEVPVAADLVAGARSLLIVAHIHPDADSLGSALALGLALERRGVTVTVSFAIPDQVPESLRGLPGQHLVAPVDAVPDDVDLLVTVDVASAERLGLLRDWLDRVPSLVIDHHPSNTGFGTYHLVDPDAEATVVLIHRMLDHLGAEVDAGIAASLYAGLATDTAGFRHVTAATHRLAAGLIDAGVEPVELLNPIVDTHPFGWLSMLSAVLGRAELDREAAGGRGLVHTAVPLADAYGLRQEELDSVIDILRTAQEAQVAMVGKQLTEFRWQISLRGSPEVDVSLLAGALGGGGHRTAAGFTWDGDYPGAVAAVTKVLDDVLRRN